MHPTLAHTLQIAALFGIISASTGWAVDHEACSDCHTSADPTTEDNGLISPPEKLCIGCHNENGVRKSDHAIGVPPGPYGSGPLPLIDGKIGCITCHDSHGKTRLLLRITTDELCLSCHRDY